jgi:uncharacterized protein
VSRPLIVLALVAAATAARGERLPLDCRGRKGCEKECAAGIGRGCWALVAMLPERATALARRGCALGDEESCHHLYTGERYREWDAEVRRTVGAAIAAARRGCEHGDALVCRSYAALLGWAFAAGEAPRDAMHAAIEHARELFRAGCDGGDPRACDELASALGGAVDLNDRIVTTEEAKAAYPLLDKACAGGYGPACGSLEWKVKDRYPDLSDEEVSARRWKLMQEACDKGDADECERSGDLAEYHDAAALPYYEKGCALDHPASCGKVAWAYGDGRDGAKRDRKRALPFAERACDAGDNSGCVMLGELIEKTDPARAKRLFALVCKREPHYSHCH